MCIRDRLNRWAEGEPVTFENLDAFKTNLAREMRGNQNGNAVMAARVVRQAADNLPLKGDAADLLPFANAARSAWKARADAMDPTKGGDPAYAAAIEGTVAPDHFVRKFITSGTATRDNVALMRRNLASNPEASQTMSVSAIDELRDAAGISPNGDGKFGQARYNAKLNQFKPKLQSLLPPAVAEKAQNIGDYARWIKEQPEGNTINNSNTLSGAIAAGAGKLATSVLNVKTGGWASVPIEYIKGKFGEAALKHKLETATAPLAGVVPRDVPGTKP